MRLYCANGLVLMRGCAPEIIGNRPVFALNQNKGQLCDFNIKFIRGYLSKQVVSMASENKTTAG